MPRPKIHPLGDHALVITSPPPANVSCQARMLQLSKLARTWENIVEVVPGINNLTIVFDPLRADPTTLARQLDQGWDASASAAKSSLASTKATDTRVPDGGEAAVVRDQLAHTTDRTPGFDAERVAEPVTEKTSAHADPVVAIRVLKAGLLTTVQNLGRHGQRYLGVSQAGALDPLSFRVANRLVGNPEACAGLEITVGQQVTLSFSGTTRIALTGADCAATLDDIPLHACHSVSVAAGQQLTLHTTSRGMRAYLAIAGGIVVPSVMDSPSTDLPAGMGGVEGRALKDGDVLSVGVAALRDAPSFGVKAPEWCDFAQVRSIHPVSREYPRTGAEACMVRLLRGPDYASFTAAAHRALWHAEWTITADSNRIAYSLSGPALERREHTDLLSHAVLPGTLHVPSSGQPIVLMGDAHTTDSHPRIGAVISADLWRLAQRRAGTPVRFVECSIADARVALQKIERYLRQLDLAIQMEQERFPCTA